jgi:hypothetical protein
MLDALVGGRTDPEVLAELARGHLRSKLPVLRDALDGCFSSHHALMVGKILAHIDYLDESIGDLSVEIERVIAPFSEQVELLDTRQISAELMPSTCAGFEQYSIEDF